MLRYWQSSLLTKECLQSSLWLVRNEELLNTNGE